MAYYYREMRKFAEAIYWQFTDRDMGDVK